MTKLEGDDKRRGTADRRDRWRRFFRVAVLCLLFFGGGTAMGFGLGAGIPADALDARGQAWDDALAAVGDSLRVELGQIRDSVLRMPPRVIEREVPFLVTRVDTVPIYGDTLIERGDPLPAEIVEVAVPGPPVPGPVRIVEVPVPQPPGVCFDSHSFTSSHTFLPGVGQFAYMGAGFLLGLLVTVEATAQAEVYVNQ